MAQGVRPMPGKGLEAAVGALDRLFKDIDPDVLLAGGFGAIAASRGIIPPFTRLLLAFNTNVNLTEDITRIGYSAIAAGPIGLASGIWGSIAAAATGQREDGSTVPPDVYALAASGAMEGMIVMTLCKNPGFLELVGKGIEKIPSVSL